ncbi:PHP domain-containing protein [Tindallia californiensis]|uniref:Polymerase/histidinol phosphatase N-terminal domain-containing protein n=1 Tax=Tindallia californiensis TaxID=159292 RepID=A0A1H3NAW7_9FIRM|nr:PHP domain-containing protein [Tindallia californiensis]SDY85988.1 hypothetical protein SAMN05192546_10535 [Tindallia californiensis]
MDTYAIDLHIHTALSPCGSEEMTPNNIINMSRLKALDIIAITDHNAIANVKPCMEVALQSDLTVIPGIEITTEEEVHLLAYFSTYDELEAFFCELKKYQANLKNRPEIFGNQMIFNSKDVMISEEKNLLMNAIQISFDSAVALINRFNGAAVPAHINRNSFSVTSSLGFLPQSLPIYCIELYERNHIENFLLSNPKYREYKHIISSDAHRLTEILERIFFMELINSTPKEVVNWMKTK